MKLLMNSEMITVKAEEKIKKLIGTKDYFVYLIHLISIDFDTVIKKLRHRMYLVLYVFHMAFNDVSDLVRLR